MGIIFFISLFFNILLVFIKDKKTKSLVFCGILAILSLSLNKLSLIFILLSILLITINIKYNWNSNNYSREFILLLFLLLTILIGLFTAEDLILFYVFFEFTLIPIFILIGVQGSRAERVKASFYFFLYTFTGSIVMLLSIIKIYILTGTTNFFFLSYIHMPMKYQIWFFMAFFLSLAVKIPMVPFHIWLPQAHVEAPMAGSVLLAGILLKLGGYGFIRFNLMFPDAAILLSPLFLMLSLMAIIYGALITCRQSDMKRLIAYSSVSHMGMVTFGVFTCSWEGFMGSIVMMLAHGFSSAALFILVGLMYSRLGTRVIKYYKGLTLTMPLLSSIFFIMILANIGFPLTINFIAECLIILTSIKYTSLINPLIIGAGMFLSVIYSFFLYNRVFFGYNSTIIRTRDLCHLETYGLVLLGLIVLIYGLWTKAYCAPPMELPELPKKPPIILPHVIIEVGEASTSQAINDPDSLNKSSTVKDESSGKKNKSSKSALIRKLIRDRLELTIERDELRDRENSQIIHKDMKIEELTRVNKHLNSVIERMIQEHGKEIRGMVIVGISGALAFTTYLSYTVYKFWI